jgi:MFS family permease
MDRQRLCRGVRWTGPARRQARRPARTAPDVRGRPAAVRRRVGRRRAFRQLGDADRVPGGSGRRRGTLAPLSLSLLAQVFHRRELPLVIGVWTGVSGLGLAIGPLAGGLLVQHSGWHAVFWVNVPIALLAAALALAGVPESADASDKRIDVPGATLVTGGLISAVAGFARAVGYPWTDSWTLTLLITGAMLLAGFTLQQMRTPSPLIPAGWLRDRHILEISAATPTCRRACGCSR